MDSVQDNLLRKAKKILKDSVVEVLTFKEFLAAIEGRKIVMAKWCGEPKCEEMIKEKTGAKSLNMPLKQPKVSGKCPFCGSEAKVVVLFGKSY